MSRPPDDRDGRPPGEGFLNRWSRLKRTGEVPAEPASPSIDPTAEAAPKEAAREGPTGDALQELLDSLPKIDALEPGQSLSAFFQAGVPEPLRNAAMRRMWTIDPAIRDFASEALDYAYDYNDPGSISGFGAYRAFAEGADEAKKLWDAAEKALLRREAPEGSGALSQQDAAPAPGQGAPAPVAALRNDDALTTPALRQPTGEGRASGLKSGEIVTATDAAPQQKAAIPIAEAAPARLAIRRHGGALPQ